MVLLKKLTCPPIALHLANAARNDSTMLQWFCQKDEVSSLLILGECIQLILSYMVQTNTSYQQVP